MTVVTNLLREKIMVLGKRTANWHERIKSSVRGQEETGKKTKTKITQYTRNTVRKMHQSKKEQRTPN